MNAAFLLLSTAVMGGDPAPVTSAPAVISTGSGCSSCGGGWAGGCGSCCDTGCESGRRGLLSRLFGRSRHEDGGCGCEAAPCATCNSCAPVYQAPSCGCNSAPACGCDTCGTERRGLFARLRDRFGRHDDCCGGCDSCGGGCGAVGGCGGSVYGAPAVGGTITTKPGGETIPAPKNGGQKPLPSGTTKPGGSVSLSAPNRNPF